MNSIDLSEYMFPNIPRLENVKSVFIQRSTSTSVVTRTAPNTSGFFHLGFFYTAMINLCFAKFHNGLHLLRIDDTDKKSEVPYAQQTIIESLEKLGINWDEGPKTIDAYGPYIQSERKIFYHTVIKYMIECGRAYPCFCTEETLHNRRALHGSTGYNGKNAICRHLSIQGVVEKIKLGLPYVIRFKSEEAIGNELKVYDLVKGIISFTRDNEDVILLKSDGLPTYHFAVVVDDWLMGITHVIRSEAGLSSAHIELRLMECLGITPPSYMHLGSIKISENGISRKISRKRDQSFELDKLFESGYDADIIRCFLMTMIKPATGVKGGFNIFIPGNEDPTTFNVKGFTITSNFFESVSNQAITSLEPDLFYFRLMAFINEQKPTEIEKVKIFGDAIKLLFQVYKNSGCKSELNNLFCYKTAFDYLFDNPMQSNLSHCTKLLIAENIVLADALRRLRGFIDAKLAYCNDKHEWSDKIEQILKTEPYFCRDKRQATRELLQTYRIFLTGKAATPDLYYVFMAIGKEEIESRIKYAIATLETKAFELQVQHVSRP